MKKLMASLVLCITAFTIVMAGDNPSRKAPSTAQMERIEKSLIKALQSDNPGLQSSAATTLLEVRRLVPTYSWSNSIIPLMRIVNDEKSDPNARIAAALALHELRSERGDFAITQNARFTSDSRVRRFCTILATNRKLERSTPAY